MSYYYYYCKKCWNRWQDNMACVNCPKCCHPLTCVSKEVRIRNQKERKKFRYITHEFRTDNKTNEVSKQ